MDSQKFSQKYGPWAVIAGGSEGVGAAFANRLAAAGINLVLLARTQERLDAAAATVRAAHPTVAVRTLALDLRSPDMIDRVIALTADIDVGLLIYNAGAESMMGDFLDRDRTNAERMIALNVEGPVRLSYHFGHKMRARGRGGIILLGSVSGYAGNPGMAMYAATKAFETTFAEGLWHELKPHGVDVLGLVLGATKTPAMERMGMRMDAPGFEGADPAAVAQEGLDYLGSGPIWHASGTAAAAGHIKSLPRDEAVEMFAAATKAMFGEAS